jgi:hypothetical protein
MPRPSAGPGPRRPVALFRDDGVACSARSAVAGRRPDRSIDYENQLSRGTQSAPHFDGSNVDRRTGGDPRPRIDELVGYPSGRALGDGSRVRPESAGQHAFAKQEPVEQRGLAGVLGASGEDARRFRRGRARCASVAALPRRDESCRSRWGPRDGNATCFKSEATCSRARSSWAGDSAWRRSFVAGVDAVASSIPKTRCSASSTTGAPCRCNSSPSTPRSTTSTSVEVLPSETQRIPGAWRTGVSATGWPSRARSALATRGRSGRLRARPRCPQRLPGSACSCGSTLPEVAGPGARGPVHSRPRDA